MKELSIKEKAKAYDGLIERLKDLQFAYRFSPLSDTIEENFPELKDNNDERTWIINYLNNRILNSTIIAEKENLKKAIAWLEKQCEHNSFSWTEDNEAKVKAMCEEGNLKPSEREWPNNLRYRVAEKNPTDKVEPKFHKDDWIVNKGHSYLIADIDYEQRRYLFEIGGYTHEQLNWEYIANADNKYHLWTIQDAKDGDVLVDNTGSILIFRGIGNQRWDDVVDFYVAFASQERKIIIQDNDEFWAKKEDNIFTPATKEQCDILFQKLKEAGYDWDVEKKELKKIEQKNMEGTFINVDEVRENFINEVYRVLANDTTNDRSNDIIYYFDSLPTICLSSNKPLPSDDDFDMNDILKNQTWDAEIEERIKNILSVLDVQMCWDGATGKKMNPYQKEIDWLKFFKDKVITHQKQ